MDKSAFASNNSLPKSSTLPHRIITSNSSVIKNENFSPTATVLPTGKNEELHKLAEIVGDHPQSSSTQRTTIKRISNQSSTQQSSPSSNYDENSNYCGVRSASTTLCKDTTADRADSPNVTPQGSSNFETSPAGAAVTHISSDSGTSCRQGVHNLELGPELQAQLRENSHAGRSPAVSVKGVQVDLPEIECKGDGHGAAAGTVLSNRANFGEQVEDNRVISPKLPTLPSAPKPSCTAALLHKIASIINTAYRTLLGVYLLTIQSLAVFSHIICVLLISPLFILRKSSFVHIERISYDWLATLVSSFNYFNGYGVEAAGDLELLRQIIKSKTDRAIVVSNHQTMSDVPLLMNFWLAMNPRGDKGSWCGDNGYRGVSWIMDWVMRYTHWGLACQTHQDFFVLQSGDLNCCMATCRRIKDKEQLREVELKRLSDYIPNGFKRHRFISLFPEGGLFANRKASSDRFATKANIPPLEHVTIPRMGALENILRTIRRFQAKSFARDMNKQTHAPCVVPISGASDETVSTLINSKSWCDQVKYVIDLTMIYPDQKRPIPVMELAFGNSLATQIRHRKAKKEYGSLRSEATVSIFVKVYHLAECPSPFDPSHPKSSDNLTPAESIKQSPFEQWWLKLFQTKDELLRHAYSNQTRNITGLAEKSTDANNNRGRAIDADAFKWQSLAISRNKLVFVHFFYAGFTAVFAMAIAGAVHYFQSLS